jgi:hypothetical protein
MKTVFFCTISLNEGDQIISVPTIIVNNVSVNQINVHRNQDAFKGLWSSFPVQKLSVNIGSQDSAVYTVIPRYYVQAYIIVYWELTVGLRIATRYVTL